MLWNQGNNKYFSLIRLPHLSQALSNPSRKFIDRYLLKPPFYVHLPQTISSLIPSTEIYINCTNYRFKLDLYHIFTSWKECFGIKEECSFYPDLLVLTSHIYSLKFLIYPLPFFLISVHLHFIFLFFPSYFILESLSISVCLPFLAIMPHDLLLLLMFIFLQFISENGIEHQKKDFFLLFFLRLFLLVIHTKSELNLSQLIIFSSFLLALDSRLIFKHIFSHL